MLEACERQVIAGQDGADTLLRRDKKILGAQLVHNDSIFGRFYRDSGPKADKIVALEILVRRPIKLLHARHFWGAQKCRAPELLQRGEGGSLDPPLLLCR